MRIMMKNTWVSGFFALQFVLGCAVLAHAGEVKRDELIRRLQLHAGVFVVSEDGKRLVSVPGEKRTLSGFSADGKFKRDWSSNSSDYGSFKLRHAWTIEPTGVVKVRFEEFSGEEFDANGVPKDFKNPIHQEEREIVDFGTVIYAVKGVRGKKVVVRFIPELAPESAVESVGNFRIMGKGISVYDSEGALWADDLEVAAPYVSITTHRGTLLLSYRAFRGSEGAGVADGKKIVIRLKDYPKITLQADGEFVPAGMNARVFAKYVKDRRTDRLNSVRTQESSDEKKFLEKAR
jgi:hypothetical protein